MKWFKFYGQDYISDPKMLSLSACARSCWITLLAYSSINDNGMITFLDEDQLMLQAGISPMHEEWENTKGILKKLESLEMISIDNGVITIKNWQKRQETNLTSYERVKRYRQKKQNDNAKITLEENRRDKNRIDKSIEVSKDTYGEFKNVKLSKEEYEKLVITFSEKNTLILIEELSGYIASKRKNYASHYATLLNWGRRRIQDYKDKKKRTII